MSASGHGAPGSPPPDGQAREPLAPGARTDRLPGAPRCPSCGAGALHGTNLAGRYRCVACLRRFQLSSACPACGAHSTIARMSATADVACPSCGQSMLQPV
ncbi:hypothetical protein HRbin41_01235 [bacterium HR41]|nr:hypothetical protein HRbin41_01235 [bacterium HR41]